MKSRSRATFSNLVFLEGIQQEFSKAISCLGRKLHLFDSFEGLPEDWSDTKFKKGHFSVTADEIFAFDPSRTAVHKGWFSDTIGPYKETYSNPVSMIHSDADLYSLTIDVLEGLNDQIVPGTILLLMKFFCPAVVRCRMMKRGP